MTKLRLAHIRMATGCKAVACLDLPRQSAQNFFIAMDLAAKVRDTVRKYGMLRRGDRVLVAVSGGPDSVALLSLVVDLRKDWGLEAEVAHREHGIRGEVAGEDALFVSRLAQ
ncbi:MAG: hypothetical protein HYV04_20035, partial [Deltaproteobacteria bacterium]|nr:hypothetical protein [Deltaproteobacteria bacterium]